MRMDRKSNHLKKTARWLMPALVVLGLLWSPTVFGSVPGRIGTDKVAPASEIFKNREPYQGVTETDRFRFLYHRQTVEIRRIIRNSSKERDRIVSVLGRDFPAPTTVVFAGSDEEFRLAQPYSRRVPTWAAGIAWPRLNYIVLKLNAHKAARRDLYNTFVHELAHVALRHATDFARLPRWFQEGVAMHLAHDWTIFYHEQLLYATLGGRLMTLDHISHAFPSERDRISVAYGQSLDFVAWVEGEYGPTRFSELFQKLADGLPLRTALAKVYPVSFEELERTWLERLNKRYSWVMLLVSGGFVWFLLAVVSVIAYITHRRRIRKQIAALPLDDEEPVFQAPD